MRLADYLGNVQWIAYSPQLAKAFTPHAAILLCWIIWKKREGQEEVEATIEQIGEETGLGRKMILNAREKLGTILKTREKRLEHKTFYSIDADALEAAWNLRDKGFPEMPKGDSDTKCQEGSPRSAEKASRTKDSEQSLEHRTFKVDSGNGHHRNGETHPEIFSLGALVQPSSPIPMAEVATGIVEHLNTATGSKFRPVASTLDPICARLREPGVDVAGVVKMIDRQVAKWKGTEMEQYLRPSTLFRASKFNEYYAAKDLPLPTNGARPKAMVERDAGLLDGGIGGFED